MECSASDGSTLVEYLTSDSKIEGANPGAAGQLRNSREKNV